MFTNLLESPPLYLSRMQMNQIHTTSSDVSLRLFLILSSLLLSFSWAIFYYQVLRSTFANFFLSLFNCALPSGYVKKHRARIYRLMLNWSIFYYQVLRSTFANFFLSLFNCALPSGYVKKYRARIYRLMLNWSIFYYQVSRSTFANFFLSLFNCALPSGYV